MHQLRARRPGRALAAALVLAGLLPRPVLGAPSAADQEIAAAERRVEGAAATPDDYVELASAFMRKSRESGDPGYYARANAAAERALALDPNHYGALRTAPWVLLGLHDFRGALAVAERAPPVETEDWWNYGTLAEPTPGRSTSFPTITWRSAASDACAPPKASSPRRSTSTGVRWRACPRPTW